MPKAGLDILQDQVVIGGSALPSADRAAFAELMLGWRRDHTATRWAARPVHPRPGHPSDVIDCLCSVAFLRPRAFRRQRSYATITGEVWSSLRSFRTLPHKVRAPP